MMRIDSQYFTLSETGCVLEEIYYTRLYVKN